MRRCPLGFGLLVAVAVVLATPGPAGAELTGACEGSGSFAQGTEADGSFSVGAREVGTATVVVPRQDSVAWTGSVEAPPGEYSGSIAVDLPPPFGQVTIDSWEGETEATENEGVEDYDLPKLVPSGVAFRVVGEHVDEATECQGFVNVEIEGDPFASPVTPIVALLTLGAGFGFFLAIRPLFRRVA